MTALTSFARSTKSPVTAALHVVDRLEVEGRGHAHRRGMFMPPSLWLRCAERRTGRRRRSAFPPPEDCSSLLAAGVGVWSAASTGGATNGVFVVRDGGVERARERDRIAMPAEVDVHHVRRLAQKVVVDGADVDIAALQRRRRRRRLRPAAARGRPSSCRRRTRPRIREPAVP